MTNSQAIRNRKGKDRDHHESQSVSPVTLIRIAYSFDAPPIFVENSKSTVAWITKASRKYHDGGSDANLPVGIALDNDWVLGDDWVLGIPHQWAGRHRKLSIETNSALSAECL